MEEKGLAQAGDAPTSASASMIQQKPAPSDLNGSTSISKDSSSRAALNDDDEEEEGMLKVDEEGQIEEDDGADSKVSQPRSTSDERPVSLADRLMPLSDAASKQTSTNAPSTTIKNGHSSPRHVPSDRDRDRDRYHDSSPGPSSAYAPQRSRFGYPPEAGASYGPASAYPYPSAHRDAGRSESYVPGSRNSFTGPASRADNARGWYPPSSTTTAPRGSDTYRPGANRERDRVREREWDSYRDGDRDRDWATMERERERDGYLDKRRDWPPRERGAAASSYEAPDPHAAYSASAASKYGFDNRDYASHRPASPSANVGRDRDFDSDRSRDRDRDRVGERDARTRAQSGMRQWGKPSDAPLRRPASDDARSDTSQRQPASRSNTTPPPLGSRETSAKPVGSDLASEKGEARSRDLSPQPTQPPESKSSIDNVRTDEQARPAEAGIVVQSQNETRSPPPSTAADQQAAAKQNDSHQQPASEAATESDAVSAVPIAAEAMEETIAGPVQGSSAAVTDVTTDSTSLNTDSTADAPISAVESKTDTEKDAYPAETAAEQQSAETTSMDVAGKPDGGQSQHDTQASSSLNVPAEPVVAQSSALQQEAEGDIAPQLDAMDAQPATDSKAAEEQLDGDSLLPASAPAKGNADVAAEQVVPSTTDDDPPAPAAGLTAEHTADDPMQGPANEPTAQAEQQTAVDGTQPTKTPDAPKAEEEPSSGIETAVKDASASTATDDSTTDASLDLQTAQSQASTDPAAAMEAPAPATLNMVEKVDQATVDVEMPDASLQPEQAQLAPVNAETDAQELGTVPDASKEADDRVQTEEGPGAGSLGATGQPVGSVQPQESAVASDADRSTAQHSQPAAAGTRDDVEMQEEAPVAPTRVDESSTAAPVVPTAKPEQVGPTETADAVASTQETNSIVERGLAVQDAPQSTNATVKEEEQPAQIGDISMTAAESERQPVEQDSKPEGRISEPVQAADADAASVVEPASAVIAVSQPPAVGEAEPLPPTSSQIQVSGPHVTATIDTVAQTQEITLPQVDYGNDNEARNLIQQENARIEEVEMPAADEEEPSLRIAEVDDADKDFEPPLMTPSTQEQVDRAIHLALRQHIASDKGVLDDWKKILKENQIVSQSTTMDVLKAKIHGIPLIVSSDQPLWLDEDDKQAERNKAHLFPQLSERKRRLNEKIEALKKRYRSINEEWKLHCSRLDRSAERREMLRRPPANTPAGTPGVFGVEEPSPGGSGGGGGGLLGASLTTGRANRRSAQTGGFAGFGDAVRSEAEFLEILASLENADMQDPNMRAARTTATAPDMFISPDSDQLTKLQYDDLNGFVADPLAFYLDEFDPDVWSEEEKAIFARRYALWPKQFGKIAQALPHKTPAQCVRYYYLNKKVPGNDFKALAAARNRERKRKARVKPKKAKGSALMADLKSAKGEEVDDVEDGSGVRSPVEATDPSGPALDSPVSSSGRRGGRARMVARSGEGGAEDVAAGRKRPADQGESEGKGGDAKSEKRKSGPKSKRAKSDSASAAEKSRKSKTSAKKDNAALDDTKAGVLNDSTAGSTGIKAEAGDEVSSAPAPPAALSADAKAGVEDSDLAAAEALGALAGLFGGPTSSGDANASSEQKPDDLDADGRKAGKKRRSKTALPGEEGAEVGGGKGRGKQPTSSYWSVAERYEFLRALVVHGPRWEVVSSTLAQKSTAQARNYFARNEDEIDFAEAAALARSHAEAPLAEREAAALAFVRQRFASNSTSAMPSLPSAAAGGAVAPALSGPGFGNEAGSIIGGTTHLPPPPGVSAFQGDAIDVKMREASPEPVVPRRGLQINSLLNDSNDATSHRGTRRSSLHDWHAERGDHPSHSATGRDASVPPSIYARQIHDLDARPLTADRLDAGRPVSSDGRPMRDDHHDVGARAYDRLEMHRPAVEGRDPRDEAVDSRSWMYDSPYEAHRRPMPSSAYAPMAPPSHPVDRSVAASRYSMPPSSVSSSGHVARSVPPLPSHLSSSTSEDGEMERERERAGAGYDMYGASARPREHESHSMPPAVSGELRRAGSGEQISPTGAHFGTSHGYGRYPSTGVGSLYASTTAASAALASRGRTANGPLTAPLPSTSERPAYEQRWRGYSQSPGPTTGASSASHAPSASSAVGGYSTGSAYRSSNSPYSSYPSQSLPRPSLPSLSASGGKVGAPHLPSLGAAGRSLPPILGTFPAPGRGAMGAGSRPAGGAGEEARYWPYPHRPRGHEQGPSSRTPE